MSTSTIGVEEGTPTKYWHTNARTISATAKEDLYVLSGESAAATYTALATGIATTTSASHILILQGDGTNYTRVRRITVSQAALAGAAATAQLQVLRTTTAGTGGGTVNARALDEGDTTPYPGVAMTLPGAKGTEGDLLLQFRLGLVAAQPVDSRNRLEWESVDKPIIIPPATTGGICIKIVTGIATSTLDVSVEFVVTTYL